MRITFLRWSFEFDLRILGLTIIRVAPPFGGDPLMFVLKKIVTLLLMPMSRSPRGFGSRRFCFCGCGAGLERPRSVLTLGVLVMTALAVSAVWPIRLSNRSDMWHPPLLGRR